MTKENYVRAVVRKLRLPRRVKKRVKNDLLSDFAARMEAGETEGQVIADMGTPEKAAAAFNESFAGELIPRRTPAEWALLAAAILCGVSVVWSAMEAFILPALFQALAGLQMRLSSSGSGSVAIIGGADGPTAIFVAGSLQIWNLLVPLILGVICTGVYIWRRKKSGPAR